MDHDAIKEFFQWKYKQLLPFQTKRIHQSFSALMSKYFTADSYDEIPDKLKRYIERQEIHPDLYDTILFGLGYPKELLELLRQKHKEIILTTPLTDYYRYSGNLNHLKTICDAFDEGFNIYELYADYRPVVDDDFSITYDWVMAPRKIYSGNKYQLDVLDYVAVYNKTPTYFISKTQLEALRERKSLVYPFKTNLIVMEMVDQTETNIVDLLTYATALFYARDLTFDIFFNGKFHQITIGQAYELWYYVLTKYTNILGDQPSGELIVLDTSLSSFPYTLDPGSVNSIENLRRIYDNLEEQGLDGSMEFNYPSNSDLGSLGNTVFNTYKQLGFGAVLVAKFYEEYVKDKFFRTIAPKTVTMQNMRNTLISKVGFELVSDIDYLLDSAENMMYETSIILGTIDDAIRTYIYNSNDELLKQYEEYLLSAFGDVLIEPELSATYQMIHTFKPFHTRLISQARTVLTVDDKTNCAAPSDAPPRYVTHVEKISGMVISEDLRLAKSFQPVLKDSITDEVLQHTVGYFFYPDRVETDELGIGPFLVGDQIFSRHLDLDHPENTTEFPLDEAKRITNIFEVDPTNRPGVYEMTLDVTEQMYMGPITTDLSQPFPRAYKIWETVHYMVDVSDSGGWFTFMSGMVACNAESFNTFSVGDYIYGPDDPRDYATRIISKDHGAYLFILESPYPGTTGTFDKAFKWRPG